MENVIHAIHQHVNSQQKLHPHRAISVAEDSSSLAGFVVALENRLGNRLEPIGFLFSGQ